MTKFPHIEVELLGHDGNAFVILGKVQRAMRKANVNQADIDEYLEEAQAGDYDHLLAVTMKTVEVC